MYKRRRFLRRPRRRIARRGTKRTGVSSRIKKYVKKAIHRQIENKFVGTGNSFSIVSAKESAYYPNVQAILPPITNGSGANGSRIGNQVKCVKGQCRAVFSLLPYNATTNAGLDPVWVKVWFIRTLATAYQGTTLSNTFIDNFFRTTAGMVGFTGNLYDLCNVPDNDSMRVLAVRQFKLGAGYASATGPVGTNSYFDNSPASKCITINWGKWAKKQLKFDNDINGDLPMNDNIYMVCQVVHSNNAYSAADYPVNCTFVSDMYYEDA